MCYLKFLILFVKKAQKIPSVFLDAFLKKQTPQCFHEFSFSYDALNRLTQVKDTQGAELPILMIA